MSPARRKTYPKYHRRRKRNDSKKSGKTLLLVVLFVISTCFISIVLAYNYLDKSFVRADSVVSDIQDKDYLTVLKIEVDDISKDAPYVVGIEFSLFDFQNKRVMNYVFSPDFKFDLGSKFGNNEMSKLFALGSLNSEDKQQGGIDLIKRFIFNYFAFPVDRYVLTDNLSSFYWDSVWLEGHSLPVFTNHIAHLARPNSYTSMDLSEVYRIASFVGSLPEDRVFNTQIDASTQSITAIDDVFKELTIDSTFSHEATSIAVLNGSSTAGMASFGARVLSNLGGRVMSINNATNKFPESFIITDDPTSYSTMLLSDVFGIFKVVDKATAGQYVPDSEIYRADILIIFGEK